MAHRDKQAKKAQVERLARKLMRERGLPWRKALGKAGQMLHREERHPGPSFETTWAGTRQATASDIEARLRQLRLRGPE